MAESNEVVGKVFSDELTKLCNACAEIDKAARVIETTLDSLVVEKEHKAARAIVRSSIEFLDDVMDRCLWNGDG